MFTGAGVGALTHSQMVGKFGRQRIKGFQMFSEGLGPRGVWCPVPVFVMPGCFFDASRGFWEVDPFTVLSLRAITKTTLALFRRENTTWRWVKT